MATHISIIGSGAIGKALAVCLARAGKKVRLLRARPSGQPASPENIELITAAEERMEASIETGDLHEQARLEGVVVLCTKSFGNEALAEALRPRLGNAALVILQNGLGVEDAFIERAFLAVYRCVLFATSQNLGPASVRFKPVTASPIGVVCGPGEDLEEIVGSLHTPAFPFKAEADIQPVIWKKAIINCAFNSICPLLEVDNGIFHRHAGILALAERALAEGRAVAAANGIELTLDDLRTTLLAISRASDGQLISTLQDIRNRRPTEIDTLNFALVERAKRQNKEHLVPEIWLLGELVQLKSILAT